MRHILQIMLIIVLTVCLIVGASFLLADRPADDPVVPQTTEAAVPESQPQTQPALEPTEETAVPTEPVLKYDTVPRYYQTDYPYDKFSEGTVISSGCSVTCLAMVASYLTDHEYTPAQMAWHFNIYGLDNVEKLEYGIEKMQLPNVRTDNVQDVYQALKEGKVAIAMMDGESFFTTTAHFIVLAGITEDDKVIINDPLEKIYSEEDTYMTTRYRDGFERFHMFQGFQGAWIYDKADMPEEPFLYDASMPQQPENRYKGYLLTQEDEDLLASFLWAEARNKSQDVRQAIAEVIFNRVVSRNFPYTVKEVIYKGEYADRIPQMKKAKDMDEGIYDAIQAAMYGPYLLPEDVFYFAQWEKGGDIWGEIGPYTFRRSRQG